MGKIGKFLRKKIINEESRVHFQFVIFYCVFAIISLIMTIFNAVTGWKLLMYITLAFSVLNFFNVVITLICPEFEKAIRVIFAIEFMALFTIFIIVGEPEGFSALWSVLLPIGGLLLYRRKWGSVISLVYFVIIVFLFWTSFGRSLLQFEYSESFLMRFPILYLGFFVVGLVFEMVRFTIQVELIGSRERYKRLSYTDKLTGLANEASYFLMVHDLNGEIEKKKAKFAIIVMDVNCLKETDDTYGHQYGCHLIIEAGRILPYIFDTELIYHIGGDEFYCVLRGSEVDHIDKYIENFDDKLSYREVYFGGKELILSIARGYAIYEEGKTFNDVLQEADDNMYKNKEKLKAKYNFKSR